MKRFFIALISKKSMNIEIDHEPTSRILSKALEKKIDQIKKPDSLSRIEFISIIETFIKMRNEKWQSFLMSLETEKIFDLEDMYMTNVGDETIYSKFYSYNEHSVCISTDKLEILK